MRREAIFSDLCREVCWYKKCAYLEASLRGPRKVLKEDPLLFGEAAKLALLWEGSPRSMEGFQDLELPQELRELFVQRLFLEVLSPRVEALAPWG